MFPLILCLISARAEFCLETILRRMWPRTPCDYGLSSWVRVFHHVLHTSCCLSTTSLPVIMVSMIQLLAFPLGKIKQPRVIAEVIGGIILGPTGLSPSPFQADVY
jgi:hypothetical protein